MASINHAAAVTLARTWICRGFVATGCLPPAAKHDGGVHDNVDVREPALVESCLFNGCCSGCSLSVISAKICP